MHHCNEHYLSNFVFQGVTYCGTSKASNLTMENVPWHEEVVSFVKKLGDLLPDYEIASEHEHSNCVLLAHRKVIHCSQVTLCCRSQNFSYIRNRSSLRN
jgi:wyosine [tRNA(Phe)-imidazoG37] synthetase (radical SAM superfamily)